MNAMRTEKDALGEKQIPSDAMYGIHSIRAQENFPGRDPFHFEWFKATGIVKLAAYQTIENYISALEENFDLKTIPFRLPKKIVLEKLQSAASELSEGEYYDQFIVPATTGGAGTSQHMNINEIITNVALKKSGYMPGDYAHIDPLEDANLFQSTNDVMPTALHVAVMQRLKVLEESINTLRGEVEKKEKKYRNVLRLAYTQMQEAVPASWGTLFSTYSDALSRDWWRVSKAFERIKVVSLGGSATGSSIGVPRYYLMEVVPRLQKLTGLPVTRGENLADATANHDSLVEVHAILKALAVNLEKMVSDLRLLASGVAGRKILKIPAVQVGSSIMPGKINPVIPEFVISAMHRVYSNDIEITKLAANGCLELNAYLPSIGNSMLVSLDLLINACKVTGEKLFSDLEVDTQLSEAEVFSSPSVTTALNPVIGYHKASVLAKKMSQDKIDIFEANKALRVISDEKLSLLMKPEKLLQAGFVMRDIIEE
jgi:aspartate ammonia-lyase